MSPQSFPIIARAGLKEGTGGGGDAKFKKYNFFFFISNISMIAYGQNAKCLNF